MTLSELVSGGSVLALAGIVVKAGIDWMSSRRQRRASDDVAEGSVGPSLVEKSFAASDTQIVVLGKQLAEERASYAAERETYERRIAARDLDLARVAAERDSLLATVERLRSQVETLQTQLDVLRTQLDEVQESIGDRPAHD